MNLFRSFTIVMLVITYMAVGCKKDDKPNQATAKGGSITVNDTVYEINPLVLAVNWGPDDGSNPFSAYSGYNINLDFYENIIQVIPNRSQPFFTQVRGSGLGLSFECYSSSSRGLSEGLYHFESNSPYPVKSFSNPEIFTTTRTDTSASWSWDHDIVGGTLEVERQEGLYNITFDLKREDSASIKGTVNVELITMDFF